MHGRSAAALGAGVFAALSLTLPAVRPQAAEFNPAARHAVTIGRAANRLIVGFRATAGNATTQRVPAQARGGLLAITRARTTALDVSGLAHRAHLTLGASRQVTADMHVMLLQTTLYGTDVDAALAALRADPAVQFADVDERRYAHAAPNDPLFGVSANATGQWFMLTPDPNGDAAATDAISAWALTTGNSGVVIADVDTGVRFDHPDLLRAGFGGRLLPGYDFVSPDYDPNSGAFLGTFLTANDGDGWDPDPSDPGDWIDATDQTKAVFMPPAPATCAVQDSSWHGTRVMGILGALTDNSVGVAGMTWKNFLLPVRALGKCGGYDSDIIAGMEWAAGMAVSDPNDPTATIPNNPYPAQIINLSLGGTGTCPSAYSDVVSTLTAMGVLVVASAGNESGPVDAPANCPGVLGVAGLRHIGTKVAYSSLGPEVSVAAPAGNCVNSSGGACLRSIDTTTNSGTTVAADNTYTDQSNYNVGTSFSAPIVAGIAGLMRSVNGNLTPTQLIARIKASAAPFPQPAALVAAGYICPTVAPSTASNAGECACPNDGSECGAGMANALAAVNSALRPIAAVKLTVAASSTLLDASGSAGACSTPSIASYAWAATPSGLIPPGATGATVTVTPTGTAGSVTLTVTDSAGATDTATLQVSATGTVMSAATTPATAGAAACPQALSVAPVAPTVAQAFSPASVGEKVTSTLTITLSNSNAFALTQSTLSVVLPTGLTVPATSSSVVAPATTCGGVAPLSNTTSAVSLTSANIPAGGSCTITVPVQSPTAGSYTVSVAAQALVTGPAGGNSAASSQALTVTAPSKGGGGAVDWWDGLLIVGVLLAGRRRAQRRST